MYFTGILCSTATSQIYKFQAHGLVMFDSNWFNELLCLHFFRSVFLLRDTIHDLWGTSIDAATGACLC